MSYLEVLPAQSTIDFDICVSVHDKTHTNNRPSNDDLSHSVINGILSTSSTGRYLYDFHHKTLGENINIPDLPPLLRGHPDVHLRNGVMKASRLAALHEPDAEKAFFVADLSYVYHQHLRWKRMLPEIEPFYGKHLPFPGAVAGPHDRLQL